MHPYRFAVRDQLEHRKHQRLSVRVGDAYWFAVRDQLEHRKHQRLSVCVGDALTIVNDLSHVHSLEHAIALVVGYKYAVAISTRLQSGRWAQPRHGARWQ